MAESGSPRLSRYVGQNPQPMQLVWLLQLVAYPLQINVLLCTPAILCRVTPERYPQINTVALTGATIPKNLAKLWAKYAAFWHCKLSLSTATVQTMEKPVSFGTTVPLRTARCQVK